VIPTETINDKPPEKSEIRLAPEQIDSMQKALYKAMSYWRKYEEEYASMLQILEMAKAGEVNIVKWMKEM